MADEEVEVRRAWWRERVERGGFDDERIRGRICDGVRKGMIVSRDCARGIPWFGGWKLVEMMAMTWVREVSHVTLLSSQGQKNPSIS